VISLIQSGINLAQQDVHNQIIDHRNSKDSQGKARFDAKGGPIAATLTEYSIEAAIADAIRYNRACSISVALDKVRDMVKAAGSSPTIDQATGLQKQMQSLQLDQQVNSILADPKLTVAQKLASVQQLRQMQSAVTANLTISTPNPTTTTLTEAVNALTAAQQKLKKDLDDAAIKQSGAVKTDLGKASAAVSALVISGSDATAGAGKLLASCVEAFNSLNSELTTNTAALATAAAADHPLVTQKIDYLMKLASLDASTLEQYRATIVGQITTLDNDLNTVASAKAVDANAVDGVAQNIIAAAPKLPTVTCAKP